MQQILARVKDELKSCEQRRRKTVFWPPSRARFRNSSLRMHRVVHENYDFEFDSMSLL